MAGQTVAGVEEYQEGSRKAVPEVDRTALLAQTLGVGKGSVLVELALAAELSGEEAGTWIVSRLA